MIKLTPFIKETILIRDHMHKHIDDRMYENEIEEFFGERVNQYEITGFLVNE